MACIHSFIQAERIVREYIEGDYMPFRPHEPLVRFPPIQYIFNDE